MFLVYSSLLIFLGRLNEIGLTHDADAFYAQKSKEMLASGNLWVLTLNGEVTLRYPPLQYWITSLSFKLFGVSGYSAILPMALMATGVVYLTYRLCEYLFDDRWAAFLAGVILLFPGFYLDNARRSHGDVPVGFFIMIAMFGFLKGTKNPRWYILYGLGTALAILTKSVLGIFPLMIAPLYLIFTGRFKELFNPWLVSSVLLAVTLGFSWHFYSWVKFGDALLQVQFGEMMMSRVLAERDNPFFFLGYFVHLLKNHWPWIPFTLAGAWVFGKKALWEKNENCLFILVWTGVIFAVLSSSRAQTYHYLISIFPPMAIMTGKIISDWTSDKRKQVFLPWMTGAVMATALLVNATAIEFPQAVTLSKNAVSARALAPVINLNVPPGDRVRNYRSRLKNAGPGLSNEILFYADRFVGGGGAKDPAGLIEKMRENPGATWITSLYRYRKLAKLYPENLYLIQATPEYAYFTSAENRKNISYDFSGDGMTYVR